MHWRKWYSNYQNSKAFIDEEAWSLFKLAAFGEALGWTLLIIGILCEKLPVAWNQYPVLVFGYIHGMLFFGYIAATFACSPSLGWRGPQTFIAGLCSVPPYGSLLYEKWAEHQRLISLTRSIQYQLLLQS